jgi:hypothetical protein
MGERQGRARVGAVLLMVLVGSIVSLVITNAAGAAPVDAGAQGARWRLVDYAQKACFDANVHDAYYGVYIEGRWRSPIDVGANGLPAGGSYTTTYAPIPPGSSTGEYSLAYVHVVLSPTPPLGRYTASMWGSDGRITRQVPIVMDVRPRCGY